MSFIEFCEERINVLSRELKEIEESISKFPHIDEIEIESYGNKKEMSKSIKREKGQRFKAIFFKPTAREIKKHIHQKEIESLRAKKKKKEKVLIQLKKIISSFDPETNSFKQAIYPNDFAIKTILEYGEKGIEEYDIILERLINLFKKITKDEVGLIGKIERDIGEQFDENLNIIEGVSTETLSFAFGKLLKVAIGSDYDTQFEMSINALKVELKVREQATGNKEKRKKLLTTQSAIRELKEYISGDKVIKSTPSLDFFEKLLIEAGINKITRQQYTIQMRELLKEEEQKENEALLKKYLSSDEIDIWNKGKSTIDQTDSQALRDLLERLTKDITSVCKYMDMMHNCDEITNSYEIIAQKIDVLKAAIHQIKSGTSEEHVFCYTTNGNNVPTILSNIETTEEMYYDEIYDSLKKLAEKGNAGITISKAADLEFKALQGENYSIVYVEHDQDTIVVSSLSNPLIRSKNLNISQSTIESVEAVINSKNLPDFSKTQSTYEDLILQTLDLRTINDSESHYRLKKTTKK